MIPLAPWRGRLRQLAWAMLAPPCYAIICFISLEATVAQTHSDFSLQWEYPAGRAADRFLLVRLDKVEKEGSGFLGIQRSPSMAGAMDDARLWTATVVDGELAGHHLHIRVPGLDVPDAATGDRVALGLVGGTICICVRKPPQHLDEAQARAWSSNQTCAQ